MSIFQNILDKILHRGRPQAQGAPAAGAAPAAPAAPQAGGAAAPQSQPASAGQPAPAAQPAQPVDVEAVLTQMASHNPQKLNWRSSIVDLMKLLDLDSSLQSRKALAQELGYGGDMNDSAAMNIWLHKQVMKKLADNGGKVPADLKD